MFETYILPVVIFAVIAIVAGVLLTIADKIFFVKTDETLEAVNSALPQINCGACGFSGCEDYAKNVVAGSATTNLCKPGGDKCSRAISEAMGVEFLDVVPVVAFVRCNGNCNATEDKYIYAGTSSCKAVNQLYNGKGMCQSSCLGLGDCIDVCAYDALSIKDNIAVVDQSKCVGCGMCEKACPKSLIAVRRAIQSIDVACSSTDNAKVTKSVCKNGCTACKLCEKKCEFDAIHVKDNHAVIDYDKCTLCGVCRDVCPRKCIHLLPVCSAVQQVV